jgi:hypothetical protein
MPLEAGRPATSSACAAPRGKVVVLGGWVLASAAATEAALHFCRAGRRQADAAGADGRQLRARAHRRPAQPRALRLRRHAGGRAKALLLSNLDPAVDPAVASASPSSTCWWSTRPSSPPPRARARGAAGRDRLREGRHRRQPRGAHAPDARRPRRRRRGARLHRPRQGLRRGGRTAPRGPQRQERPALAEEEPRRRPRRAARRRRLGARQARRRPRSRSPPTRSPPTAARCACRRWCAPSCSTATRTCCRHRWPRCGCTPTTPPARPAGR